MSKLTLVKILKDALDNESDNIRQARHDQKVIKNNKLGLKTFRKLIADQIKVLKANLKEADRTGGGKKAGDIQRSINYLRSVLNELTAELEMVVLQVGQCAAYLRQSEGRVRVIDAEWEKAKADEATQTEQA